MRAITKTTPEGTTHHCTARCYNSTTKKCTCICKRLLHGKGEAYAMRMAPMAAMYLQLQDLFDGEYFPASELVQDNRSR